MENDAPHSAGGRPDAASAAGPERGPGRPAGPARSDGPSRGEHAAATEANAGGAELADFAAPSTRASELSADRFVGKVPVILVFLPHSGVAPATLRQLDEAHTELGRRTVQLLVVHQGKLARAQERADEVGLSVPLLADEDGAIGRRFDAVGDGDALVVLRIGLDGRVEERREVPLRGDLRAALLELVAA